MVEESEIGRLGFEKKRVVFPIVTSSYLRSHWLEIFKKQSQIGA